MDLTQKKYNIIKIKHYLIKNDLFFFYHGINRKSNEWINVEQDLNKMSFSYYKILNKIFKNTINKSIYTNISPLANSVTFLIKPKNNIKNINKNILINNFEYLVFMLLAIKLNNKIYSKNQLNNNFSFVYKESKLLFFQFNVTNTKINLKIKSK